MIKLFYCSDPNFGDAMSPLIVERLSGRKVIEAGVWDADMMAVGSVFYHGGYFMGDWRSAWMNGVPSSIFSVLSRPVKVWGSGFLKQPIIQNRFLKRRLSVYALRGKWTHRILEKYGFRIDAESIAYGDPGLLYASLFCIRRDVQYDLGIVAHVCDADEGKKLGAAFAKVGVRVNIIDVTQAPSIVVGEIAKCEKIISSSLHGLVVSDSLGIPNLHIQFSSLTHSQDDFELKFRDYYSAFDEEMPDIVPSEAIWKDLLEYSRGAHYSVRNREKVVAVQDSLQATFPMKAGVSDCLWEDWRDRFNAV